MRKEMKASEKDRYIFIGKDMTRYDKNILYQNIFSK